MKVGIIGYGFVGKALANGIKSEASIFKVDPKLKTTIEDLVSFDPDIIFICVPTPLQEDLKIDTSIVFSTVEEILRFDLNSLIVLKSTILPNYLIDIENKIKRFIYNPEFLREKHAEEDFINSDMIVLGGDKKEINDLKSFYSKYTKCISKDYIETDIVTASLIKYTINTFLATKVSFFNELKEIYRNINATDSWENFISYLQKDNRMGSSHMSVPGHDGKKGFGGACLPKDSFSMYNFSKEINLDLRILKTAIDVNNRIRAEYNEDPRELEQRIRFNDKT